MPDALNGANRYRVVYSERVRQETFQLILRAKSLGKAAEVIAAVETIDRILRIYPQFGQPLRDLVLDQAQLWIAVLPPLVVKYILDEKNKIVMVPVPFSTLSKSGL